MNDAPNVLTIFQVIKDKDIRISDTAAAILVLAHIIMTKGVN